MSRKLFMLICLTLALLFVFSISGVNAYDCDRDKNCPKGKGCYQKGIDDQFEFKVNLYLHNKEELGLSDEQVEAIKNLKLKTSQALIMMDAEIEVAGLDIEAAMHKDSIDLEAVNAVIDKKYEIKKAKAKLLTKSYSELKNILTNDQRDKLMSLWKEKKEEKASP